MVNKRSYSEKLFDVINILILSLLTIITFYPFIYVAFASVSNASDLIAHEGLLLRPLGFATGAYKMVFKNPMITRGYLNTIFIVVVGTILNLMLTSLGAYVLSRKNLMLKKFFMGMFVVTMFFSGGLIPFYLVVKDLGLRDSLWALIIPVAMSTMNTIIMRTSFMGLPDSLEESAKIDGANDFTVLFRVILPLSKPVIAVMILYYGVGHWNAWFYAMIFISERKLYPLQLILREILLQNDVSIMTAGVPGLDQEPVAETIKYATIMVATLPVLCIYPFLQKYFVKGVMIGALKG